MAKLASRDGVKQQLRFWSSPDPVSVGDRLSRGEDRVGSITSAVNDGTQGWIGLARCVGQCWMKRPERPGRTDPDLRRPSGLKIPADLRLRGLFSSSSYWATAQVARQSSRL